MVVAVVVVLTIAIFTPHYSPSINDVARDYGIKTRVIRVGHIFGLDRGVAKEIGVLNDGIASKGIITIIDTSIVILVFVVSLGIGRFVVMGMGGLFMGGVCGIEVLATAVLVIVVIVVLVIVVLFLLRLGYCGRVSFGHRGL